MGTDTEEETSLTWGNTRAFYQYQYQSLVQDLEMISSIYIYTSVSPVHNAQVCYFNNVCARGEIKIPLSPKTTTYLPTHLPIELPTYLCASFSTFQVVPTFSFPAFSLPTLPTFSLFLLKTTPYLPTYLSACLSGSFSYLPSWLREKAKSR